MMQVGETLAQKVEFDLANRHEITKIQSVKTDENMIGR